MTTNNTNPTDNTSDANDAVVDTIALNLTPKEAICVAAAIRFAQAFFADRAPDPQVMASITLTLPHSMTVLTKIKERAEDKLETRLGAEGLAAVKAQAQSRIIRPN